MTTPSPNPVESLRALPELPVAYISEAMFNILRKGVFGTYDTQIANVETRNKKRPLYSRPASAPDAELLTGWQFQKDGNQMKVLAPDGGGVVCFEGRRSGSIAEHILYQLATAILAKHSTAAEEGHG